MKQLLFVITACVLLSACVTRTKKTTTTTDSLAVDSVQDADTPAPATLAFSQQAGYSVKNTVGLKDTVNFIYLSSQQELDNKFILDKTSASSLTKPDFLINYNVAVICLPSQLMTTIVMDKVELGNAINVFLTIQRGEKQTFTSKPAQIFAIERRNGYGTMQFYVNGKESGAIILPVE